MVPLGEIKDLKFLGTLPLETLQALAEEFEEQSFETGELIIHQHDQARALHVLLAGSVEFLMAVEGMDDLFVGETDESGALIGWSVVRRPHRYTASVRCRNPCRTLRLSRGALDRLMGDDPQAGRHVLAMVAAALVERLEDARDLLGRSTEVAPRTDG
jgi:CRP-like cAMP-binding protein